MVKKSNFFLNCNWTDAIDYIGNMFNDYYQKWDFGYLRLIDIQKFNLAVFHGPLADINTVAMIKNFLFTAHNFNSNQPNPRHKSIFIYQSPFFFNADFFENFTFGSDYKNFGIIDFLLLINVNLRLEVPLLNLKIKKLHSKNNLVVCSVGYLTNLTFEHFNLGNSLSSFVDILKGRHLICKKLIKSTHPMILMGEKFFYNRSGFEIFYNFSNFFKQIFNYKTAPKFLFQIMPSACGILHSIAVGINRRFKNVSYFQKKRRERYFFILLNTDNIHENFNFLNKDFIVYMGHNGGADLNNVDLILPVVNYLEKKSSYINIEGRVQTTQFLVEPPILAAEEWMIFIALLTYVFLPSLNTYYELDQLFSYGKRNSTRRITAAFVCYRLMKKHLRRVKRLFKAKNFSQSYFKNSLFPSFRYRKKYLGFYRNVDFLRQFDDLKYIKTSGDNYFFSANSRNFLLSDPITKSSSILASATVKLEERNFN